MKRILESDTKITQKQMKRQLSIRVYYYRDIINALAIIGVA